MIKYVFCDHDDVLVSSSPRINGYVDPYVEELLKSNNSGNMKLGRNISSLRLEAIERNIASAKKDLDNVKKESARAFEAKELPKFMPAFKVDNDVIKDDLLSGKISEAEYLDKTYLKPIRIAESAVEAVLEDKEVFMENRDCFLENDNKNAKGVVDYHYIHRFDVNRKDDFVNHLAVDTLNRVVDEGLFDGVFELSHHNGGREVDAKLEFNKAAFGNKIPFMGQRFHSSEHVEGERRGRSCKVDSIRGKFEISESVLIDDSLANVIMWTNEGGPCIWYKPLTDEEKTTGVVKPMDSKISGAVRLTVFDYEHLMEAVRELNDKKVLVK